ncbi:MAG: hypothetical protein HC894_02315 [Microcoleus sp. SM1_3_4]|nr:hypothetical protein [Microcoleus sp. SM1_3_4]
MRSDSINWFRLLAIGSEFLSVPVGANSENSLGMWACWPTPAAACLRIAKVRMAIVRGCGCSSKTSIALLIMLRNT